MACALLLAVLVLAGMSSTGVSGVRHRRDRNWASRTASAAGANEPGAAAAGEPDDAGAGEPGTVTTAQAASAAAVVAAPAAVTASFDAIVVGAGLSGLKAAVDLRAAGLSVAVLEGRPRIGGRVFSTRLGSGTYSAEVGAQWFHGTSTNADLMCVRSIATGQLGVTPVSTGTSTLVRATGSATVVDDTPYWTINSQLWSWANARTWPASASLQTALTQYASAAGLTAAQQLGLAYTINTDVEQEFGASASWLSMNLYDEGLSLPGGDSVMPLGKNLSSIPAWLAAQLPAGAVRLSTNVTNIAYDSAAGVTVTAVSGGATQTFAAKAAIVTLPLGVLQRRGAGLFSPALPAAKQAAISRLGMSLLNKVILELPASYASGPFAAPDSGKWWVDRLPADAADAKNFLELFNIKRALGAPLVVAFQAGQPAVNTENGMDDAATVAALMAQLRAWYGSSVPDPVSSYVTRWWNDPWTFGSYSYQTPACTGTERSAFATPEPSARGATARLWFAGEHTHVDYPATMQGAFLSGKRAAAAVAAAFRPAGR